jgi:GTP-binding protein Era
VLTRPDAQVIFMDTPGIHQPFHKLGEYMVEVARRAIPDADVVVFLVDASQWPDEEDRMIAELLKEQAADKPVILALNKIDLLKSDREAHLAAYRALAPTPPDAEPPFPWEEVQISAIRGDNLDQLLERIIAHLPEGPRYYDPEMLTDQPMQMIVAELIREKALLLLREEVPHGIAVEITDWVDRNPNLTYIAATIYVEKETHKPIVIGENGQMLKRIGAAARQEIEALLGHAVYLELWVKVRKNWRRDPEQLRRLGYALPRERKGRR